MLGKAIAALQQIGDLEVAGINLDENVATYHRIKSKFRDEVIVPYLAISQNATFFTSKGEHFVTTADDVLCKVKEWDEKSICDLEEDILRLYKVSAWDFLKKWNKYESGMTSLYFLHLKLEECKKE